MDTNFDQPDDGDSAGSGPDPARQEANFFEEYGARPFVDADDDNRSTFALDVDTGSYTITRRWLNEGVAPDPASVRVEEFVNAFDYDYRVPCRGLSLHVDGAPSPYDDDNVLVRIGVHLVKEALEALVSQLDRNETVARPASRPATTWPRMRSSKAASTG